jgi:hypothetical protein
MSYSCPYVKLSCPKNDNYNNNREIGKAMVLAKARSNSIDKIIIIKITLP